MKSARAVAMAMAILVASVGVASAQSTKDTKDQMTGRHTMEGKVTSVSAKTGWVHVKTDEGTIIVHFPPAELEGVKKGDTIAVDLAMKDNGPAKPKAASRK
jgi:hypothetical protein